MSLTNIRAALETYLDELSGLPEIAWENVDFDPAYDSPLIQAHIQVQRERKASMGPGSLIRREGLFILSIHTPRGQGMQEADVLGDILVQHFSEDTVTESLTVSGTTVRIRYAERRAPVEMKQWNISNVVISWFTDDANI